jgi:putative tryptophan/tyrosine transport system substrate-binding protein
MNTRRKLIIAFGASALTAPFASFAQQQGKIWRVGFLSQRARPDSLDSGAISELRRGMRELGYVEGKNLNIEWRFADGKAERLPGLAAELAQMKVGIIVAVGSLATSAAQRATTTIPIVMVSVSDPVGIGLVKSLARPGGNITGLSDLLGDISSKHLELLLGMVPKLTRVAVMVNPVNGSNATILKNIQVAAQRTAVKILPVEIERSQNIEKAFSLMIKDKVGAVIVASDGLFFQQASQIAKLAAKNRLPTISWVREYVEAGGLMSYGANITDLYWRSATYVDKIFKGAEPGDLPVEQPTKFELVINGKTAKALGLNIPQSLLVMTDKVIE